MSEPGDLISKAVEGDADALRRLLASHGPRVAGELASEIGPQWRAQIDADDVMQVTYLEAFLQIRSLGARDEAGFVAWLRRIAQNNLRDAIKELQRQKRPNPAKRVHAVPAGDASYVTLIEVLGGSTSATPSRDAARREVSEVVEEMLNRLPRDYATVIRSYDLAGKDIAEVAVEMNRSPGAVHMLRARAHDRLRTLLGSAANFFTRA